MGRNDLFDTTIGGGLASTTTSGYAQLDHSGHFLLPTLTTTEPIAYRQWDGSTWTTIGLTKMMLPSKVNFHPDQKATVVYFGKDKVVTRASDDDEFDPTFGFLLAYFQYHSGLTKKKANDYIHSLTAEK